MATHSNAITQPRRDRAYAHEDCGQETVIGEDDFEGLVNPYLFVHSTYCVHCRRADKLSKFEWSDTQERLHIYRERLRQMAPFTGKLINWVIGPVIGLTIIAGSWWLLGRWWVTLPIALVALLCWWVVVPLLLPKILNIDYRNID